MEKELKRLKLDGIAPAAWNPRTEAELAEDHPAMKELVASVKAVGVIQPIDVWTDDGMVLGIVLAGSRRVKAASLAGLKEIPAMVFKGITEAQAREITRIENEVRRGVDPMKDASLIGEMLGLGFTQKEIAARFGVSEAQICRRRKLLDLCPKIRERAESADGNITIDALEHIAVYPLEIQEACARDILNRAKQSAIALRWRDVSWMISQRTKDLRTARFDTKACESCTNRTGAMPDLFGETKTDTLGQCLGVDCFCKKMKDHAIGKLREKYGAVEMVDAVENGIEGSYAARGLTVFGEKKAKARPVLWYWINNSYCEPTALFGPTVADWKKLCKSRDEKLKKAKAKAEAEEKAAKERNDANNKLLDERAELYKALDNAVYVVAEKAWKTVDYCQYSDANNSAGIKVIENALRLCIRDTAQRSAIANLLVSCFDTDIGLDNEVVAFCGAFPDFAKKCGIKNEEFVAITQARAALDKFHKEHPEIKD
ncbi:MAG: ParB/RepB/Spo0J family partition protein [Kiritimatiellae bacterium]|nr:ParB/RepB/Spo0J family partition protein [Kiritimatiellia bacterium]